MIAFSTRRNVCECVASNFRYFVATDISFRFVAIVLFQALFKLSFGAVPFIYDLSPNKNPCCHLPWTSPVENCRFDLLKAIHLSAHGQSPSAWCYLGIVTDGANAIIVEWEKPWKTNDSQVSMSMYARFHALNEWHPVYWEVSNTALARAAPIVISWQDPNNSLPSTEMAVVIRLELNNPIQSLIDFRINLLPSASSWHLAEQFSIIDIFGDSAYKNTALANLSYYSSSYLSNWELAFIAVSAAFGICIVSIALYFLIFFLSRNNGNNHFDNNQL